MGAQYSAAKKTSTWVEMHSVFTATPHVVPARLLMRAMWDITLPLLSPGVVDISLALAFGPASHQGRLGLLGTLGACFSAEHRAHEWLPCY